MSSPNPNANNYWSSQYPNTQQQYEQQQYQSFQRSLELEHYHDLVGLPPLPSLSPTSAPLGSASNGYIQSNAVGNNAYGNSLTAHAANIHPNGGGSGTPPLPNYPAPTATALAHGVHFAHAQDPFAMGQFAPVTHDQQQFVQHVGRPPHTDPHRQNSRQTPSPARSHTSHHSHHSNHSQQAGTPSGQIQQQFSFAVSPQPPPTGLSSEGVPPHASIISNSQGRQFSSSPNSLIYSLPSDQQPAQVSHGVKRMRHNTGNSVGYNLSSPPAGPSTLQPPVLGQSIQDMTCDEPEGYEYGESGFPGEFDGEYVSGFASQGRTGQPLPGPSNGQNAGQPGAAERPRPHGACVRCKTLKVRCEFQGDNGICRRCTNGGHSCEIPGRKKRKQPPKREFLLNQIRDQAAQIQELMSKLASAERRTHAAAPPPYLPRRSSSIPISSLNPDSDPSPLRTSRATHGGQNSLPGEGVSAPEGAQADSGGGLAGFQPEQDPVSRPDVRDWIARARESVRAIGGLIDNGAFAEADDEGEFNGDGGSESEDESEGDWIWEEGPSVGGEGQSGRLETLDETDERENWDEVAHDETMDRGVAGREDSVGPLSPQHHGERSQVSRRSTTPQPPPRLAPLPAHPGVPVALIAALSIASERAASLSPSTPKRLNSIEPGYEDALSPSVHDQDEKMIDGTFVTSPGRAVNEDADVDVTVEPAEPGQGDVEADAQQSAENGLGPRTNAYGVNAQGFFEARRGSVGDPSHFVPSRHPIPHIIVRGIVTPAEAEKLFDLYFDKMNLSCSLLDPILYTAQATYWRSPFLFTVICGISSRYYSERQGLYEELMNYAQLAAGTALISGPKTVETVAAYILLSLYPVPMRRWEEDRTWLYLGMAIRVATDLNLHLPNKQKPRSEAHARELLNRTRIWLNCYNLDRSTASWHGKGYSIDDKDYVGTHANEWYNANPYNMKDFDIHLACYNAELRVMAEFRRRVYSSSKTLTGLSRELDIAQLASETDEKMQAMHAEWTEKLVAETNPNDSQAQFRNGLIRCAYAYARLVILSFGFENVIGKKGLEEERPFFARCYKAALDVVNVFTRTLSSYKDYLRCGPEAQCVFVTFASAFLIKLLHPTYSAFLSQGNREEIKSSVQSIIDLLGDKDVWVDEKHSPLLWSRFLKGLLATPMAKVTLSASALKLKKHRSKAHRRKSEKAAGDRTREGIPLRAQSEGAVSSSGTSDSGGSTGRIPERHMSPDTIAPSSLAAVAEDAGAQYGRQLQDDPRTGGLGAVDGSSQAYGHHTGHGAVQGAHPAPMPVSLNDSGLGSLNAGDYGLMGVAAGVDGALGDALQTNVPLFQPLPLGNEFFQGVQQIEDPSVWQEMALPGFNWLNSWQTGDANQQLESLASMDYLNIDRLQPGQNF